MSAGAPELTTPQPGTGETPCGFLDLPPELRNRIYTFLLPQDDFVLIKCLDNGRVRPCSLRTGLHELSQLVRVCAQLQLEVVPIFYGSINFCFKMFRYLVGWLRSIGSMVKHVRMIEVYRWNNVDARTAVAKLQAASCLTTFSLSVEVPRKSVTVVAATFVPLIKALLGYASQPDTEAKVFGIVRAVPDSIQERLRPGAVKTWRRQAAEEYTSALQADLRRRLA